MAVYNAKYIPDMEKANPTPNDPKKEGDDAIREIKDVLQTTFPNFQTGETFDGTTDDLNSLVSANLPRDSIVMWVGDQVALPDGPAGWTICDGRPRKSGGGSAPNMAGRFITAAQPDTGTDLFVPYAKETGGNAETVIKDINSDLVELNTQGHALTAQELPPHSHLMYHNDDGTDGGVSASTNVAAQGASGGRSYEMTVSEGNPNVGKSGTGNFSNSGHSHKFTIETSGTGSNVPQFYAAVYIIKD